MTASPLALYDQARQRQDAAAGFYNHNVRVDTTAGPVLVRIPIPGAATMDLAIWPEAEVLAAVGPYLRGVPRVRHASTDPAFQIHEFVEGDLVDDIAPRGVRVPPRVTADVVAFLGDLTAMPRRVLPPTPAGWPADGDTAGFAARLSEVTACVHATYQPEFAGLFTALGIPADPLAVVLGQWARLARRSFRLVHADVHRKNMIDTGTRTVFLDWELALWGDPLYDLAVHLHKMSYQPDEQQSVVRGWVSAVPPDCSVGWAEDLTRYLTHERVKSAVVDTVRYTRLINSATLDTGGEQALLEKLAGKLNNAYPCWDLDQTTNPAAVEDRVRRHAR